MTRATIAHKIKGDKQVEENTTPTQTDMPAPQVQTDDTPVVQEQPQEAPQTLTTEAPAEATTTTEAPQAPTETVDEEEAYPTYQQVPSVPPIDFSQLPVDENNLIDPNALAQQINSRIAMAEQNAAARAQQIYAEQETEKRLWEKAYEKHPELKSNKELRDMVHNARLGKVTELLSSTNDPSQIKLPTPGQMADTLFKHISAQKEAGFQQATQNTVVQQSAVLEQSGKAGDSSADALQNAKANLNNPNKQIADKARSELLKKYLGWN